MVKASPEHYKIPIYQTTAGAGSMMASSNAAHKRMLESASHQNLRNKTMTGGEGLAPAPISPYTGPSSGPHSAGKNMKNGAQHTINAQVAGIGDNDVPEVGTPHKSSSTGGYRKRRKKHKTKRKRKKTSKKKKTKKHHKNIKQKKRKKKKRKKGGSKNK
jgi:hypothetical protein